MLDTDLSIGIRVLLAGLIETYYSTVSYIIHGNYWTARLIPIYIERVGYNVFVQYLLILLTIRFYTCYDFDSDRDNFSIGDLCISSIVIMY